MINFKFHPYRPKNLVNRKCFWYNKRKATKGVVWMRIETERGAFSFRCLMAGQFVGGKGWTHPRSSPGHYEVIYMLEGELSLQEGLSAYILSPGDTLVLSADLPRFGMLPSGKKLSFYWMEFETDAPEMLGVRASCKARCETRELAALFKQLLLIRDREEYPAGADDYAAMLLLCEVAAVQRAAATDAPKVVQEIAAWVRRNIKNPITAADVGREFGYNPDYLTALFKENFGMGLKEYINAHKLRKAEEYLKGTDCPVKEIAAMLGFASANQFIKYFTYHEGVSPSRYRTAYFHQKM